MFSLKHLLILIFFILSLMGAFHHELSLDEARVWISMQEIGLTSLVSDTRCEMHCLPWFYVVKTLTSVFTHPLSMQILTIILGTVVFAIISLLSPFTILEKCLLLFNYYFFFEYNLLSRPYVLMTMGMVLVCLTFADRKVKPLPFVFALLFLENSTYFGIFLTFPFVSLFIWEILSGKIEFERTLLRKISALGILYLGFFIWYALPVSSVYNCFNLSTKDLSVNFVRFQESIWDVARAFFPVATDTWNEHLFDTSSTGKSILSIFWISFIGFTLWSIRKNREALYLLGTGVFLIFAYRFCKPIYFGSFLRHLGALSIMYVGCMWIARKAQPDNKSMKILFLIFLLPGAFSGVRMYKEDYFRKFSHGIDVHEFISKKEYEGYEIIPDSLLFTSSYLVYSDLRYFSFIDKNHVRVFPLSFNRQQVPVAPAHVRGIHIVPRLPEGILRDIVREQTRSADYRGFLILNYPPGNLPAELELRPVIEFTGAINANEDYYIFSK
ncbi:MAG: hypothetical protein V4598_12855 [Bdellovibrionota bacterium]